MYQIGRAALGIHRVLRIPATVASRHYATRSEIKSSWKARLAQLDSLFLTGMTRFHEITGYAEIEKMKHELIILEEKVGTLRKLVKEVRDSYNNRLADRSNSQREMNELLMRKQTWLPEDLDRFTELYKNDHQIQQAVFESKKKYDEVEAELDDVQQQAAKLIGARYREEQLWSDRIRQASTWGTWVLMGINVFLFIIVQLILEPWKRRRLVRSFETKVQEMLDEKQPHPTQATEPATPSTQAPQLPAPLEAQPETQLTRSNELTWSSLSHRLASVDASKTIELRPVEAGVLALGAGFTMAGAVLALGAVFR